MGAGDGDLTPLVQKPLQQRCCVPITRHSACLRHGKGNRSSQPLVVRTAGHTTDCALTVNIVIHNINFIYQNKINNNTFELTLCIFITLFCQCFLAVPALIRNLYRRHLFLITLPNLADSLYE